VRQRRFLAEPPDCGPAPMAASCILRQLCHAVDKEPAARHLRINQTENDRGRVREDEMYCSACQHEIMDYSNFCSFCGARQSPSVAPRRLMRSAWDKKIAGVCGGFSEHFDMDPTISGSSLCS